MILLFIIILFALKPLTLIMSFHIAIMYIILYCKHNFRSTIVSIDEIVTRKKCVTSFTLMRYTVYLWVESEMERGKEESFSGVEHLQKRFVE